MRPNAPDFISLLRLTPDDFTHQGKSAATRRVNLVLLVSKLKIMYLILRDISHIMSISTIFIGQHYQPMETG
jgi:hypothetical protein